jgi:hypothetical protein
VKSSLERSRGALLAVLAALLFTCDVGDRSGGMGTQVFPQVSATLADRGEWRRLGSSGTFMTTPRWTPDGRGVVASGFHGVGLYYLAADGGAPVTVDSSFRGLVTFDGDGRTLCLDPAGESGIFQASIAGGPPLPADPSVGCRVPGENPLRVLFDRGGKRVVWDELYGTLTWQDAEAGTTIESAGAWAVAVSPDGGSLAWCTGNLKMPSLFVYDGAEKIDVGRGAHPSWVPGGRYLVYDLPEAADRQAGRGPIVASELFVYDVRARLSARLTDTPGAIEMQPVVSPDGSAVAFSDWKTGAITIAPLKGTGP